MRIQSDTARHIQSNGIGNNNNNHLMPFIIATRHEHKSWLFTFILQMEYWTVCIAVDISNHFFQSRFVCLCFDWVHWKKVSRRIVLVAMWLLIRLAFGQLNRVWFLIYCICYSALVDTCDIQGHICLLSPNVMLSFNCNHSSRIIMEWWRDLIKKNYRKNFI